MLYLLCFSCSVEEIIVKLSVLLSCMHQKDISICEDLHITSDVTIINQCDNIADEIFDKGSSRVRFISTKDRGLSKSRNMAIKEADNDICILCDNDVVYTNDYENIILSAYERNKDADICVFFIRRDERQTPVCDKETTLSYLGAMKIFSPEMSFKRSALDKVGLRFNECFGAGATYGMGEENIFLWEAKRRGLKVIYVPIEIAATKPNESTWFKGYNDKFFIDRGAGYFAMSKSLWWLLSLQFAVRKYNLYKADNTFFNALRCMHQGKNSYENICSR